MAQAILEGNGERPEDTGFQLAWPVWFQHPDHHHLRLYFALHHFAVVEHHFLVVTLCEDLYPVPAVHE